jgi:membrane protease subunit HflK
VTRQRLYYETIEEVLANTNKVLVDTKGNSNMLYLPLDKMMERRAPAQAQEPEAPVETVEARRERGTR